MFKNHRFILSLITLLLTAAWVVLMILAQASTETPATVEQAVARIESLGSLFYLTYLNAALLTIFATLLMVALYGYCKPHLPEWAALAGLVFTPVYTAFNLFAYLSQVSIVPLLVKLYQVEGTRQTAEVLLRLSIQDWPQSGVGFFNNLAYAILGIPSILYGVALYRRGGKALRAAAVLLALNGLACMLGVAGILMDNAPLSTGSMVGGMLFFLALFPLTWAFGRAGG